MGAFSLHVFDNACSRASDECRKGKTALSFCAWIGCPRFGYERKTEKRNVADLKRSMMALVAAFLVGGVTMSDSASLNAAKTAKKDEFYTQRVDIENELRQYKSHFAGKVVLCNCDDPRQSEFFRYFSENFEKLKLKRLIATCYKSQDVDLFSQHDCERAIKQIYEGDRNGNMVVDDDEVGVFELKGDGDFRSEECIELLRQADIVVTNPPFSLFREYVAQLVKYGKKFLIIGNQNAITYKEIFPLLMANRIWIGYKFGDMAFKVPSNSEPRATRYWQDETGQKWRSMGNICWYTNLDIQKRHEFLPLYKKYTPEEFPKYDNYDAINVDKVADIPVDYDGVMGVPITFLDKYNPEQFGIVGITNHGDMAGIPFKNGNCFAEIGGKRKYIRIFIRRRRAAK